MVKDLYRRQLSRAPRPDEVFEMSACENADQNGVDLVRGLVHVCTIADSSSPLPAVKKVRCAV
jgi:hypothetical protein